MDGPAPVAGGARATILVADDAAAVRGYVAQALRLAGYDVIEACDGAEALELVQARGASIALLVTDLAMPRMGGLELAARVAALTPRTPVLFMSCCDDEALPASDDARRTAFLQKPFAPSALATQVATLLR